MALGLQCGSFLNVPLWHCKPSALIGYLLWDWFILVLTWRPAPHCSLFISLASLAKLPDSLWGQRNSSIMFRAHLCPYSSQKEPSSTITAFFQRSYHHVITLYEQAAANWIDLNLTKLGERTIRPGHWLDFLNTEFPFWIDHKALIIYQLSYWSLKIVCDGEHGALKSNAE